MMQTLLTCSGSVNLIALIHSLMAARQCLMTFSENCLVPSDEDEALMWLHRAHMGLAEASSSPEKLA